MQPQYTSSSITPSRQTPADSDSQPHSQILVAPQRPLSVSHSPDPNDSTSYNHREIAQLPVSQFPHNEVSNQYSYDKTTNRRADEKDEVPSASHDGPSRFLNLSTDPEIRDNGTMLSPSTSLPRPLPEVDTQEPYNEASAGLSSPQSVHSSNKTPTQADFTSLNQNHNVDYSPAPPEHSLPYNETSSSVRPRSAVSAADLAVDPKNGNKQPFAPSQSPYHLQSQHSVDRTINVHNDQIPSDRSGAIREPEDPDATYHSAASHTQPAFTRSPNQHSLIQPDTQHRVEEQPPIDNPSSLVALISDIPAADSTTVKDASIQPAPRPFSFLDTTPNQSGRQSIQNSQRAPSVDSLPSHMHQDRPPSPVSPQHSVIQEVTSQRGRNGPVRYGTDHDFLPEHSQTSTPKRRSQSLSRLLKRSDHESPSGDERNTSKRRSRSISRLFKNPDINDHPAYRQDALPQGGTDMPIDYYPEQLNPGDAIIPRQQATEYQLEGVGPPPTQAAGARSRSRKNSKASSFFKASSSPTKQSPSPQNGSEGQSMTSPVDSPVTTQKRTKRVSLFRSMTGQRGHERDQTRESSIPSLPASGGERSQHSGPATPQGNDNSVPSRDETSKVRNKLQRASTSGFQKQEKDVGKKKRFSAMGVSITSQMSTR